MRTVLFVATLFVTLSTAGCLDGILGGDPEGELSISLENSGTAVSLEIDGIFARAAGTEDGWVQLVGNGTDTWELGSADGTSTGTVKAQTYDLLQVVFASVTSDGTEATLTENGFELPIPFNVTDGGTTDILLGFAWADALFESQQGLAFAPALRKVVVTEDGVETINLEADEISAGPTKAPVARMRVLDEVWQIWESDFLAESADKRKKGTAGNLTLLGSASEPLAPGATIDSFQWDFSDGVSLSGTTVNRVFDLNGGNVSVTLTVTDSNGVSDTQRLDLALQPGSVSTTTPWKLEGLTGLAPTGNAAACTQLAGVAPNPLVTPQTVTLPIDPSTTPTGNSAGVSEIQLQMTPQAPHTQVKVDVVLADGAGNMVTQKTGNGADADLSKKYDPSGAQPEAGDWTITAYPCRAYDITVTGFLSVFWQGVGDPAFGAWYAGYDDGENR